MALGFFVNNQNCYGCKTCSMSCTTNKLPGNYVTYMRCVNEFLSEEGLGGTFLSLACNHCDNPACLENCPQGAYTKLENGIVKQDHDKCIGCQTCVQACPYGAPKYDEAEGKVHKCDLCFDRLDRGELPACMEACPGGNIVYGEMEELKANYPAAVSEIAGVTPAASETNPNLIILVAEKK